MEADASRRAHAAQAAQGGSAASSGSIVTLDDIIAGGTAGLITKVAGAALVAPKNAAGSKQPSMSQLLERFER